LCDILSESCDETPINTGLKIGVLAKLEQHYGYNIQWLVCQLHANELPLRHLISVKDEKSKGPNSFSGPIGKPLIGCEKLPITPFEFISGDEIIVNIPDLSTDQKYLAEKHRAVTTGSVNESLSHRDPGNINLSRWLTIANRILRFMFLRMNLRHSLLR